MKRLVCLVLLGVSTFVFGQQTIDRDTLSNPLIPVNKQNFLKDLDLIFYMRYGLDSYLDQNKFTTGHFNGNELRLDLTAKVHEKVGFRFRNRFTSSPTPGTLDNVNSTVDIAFIDIKATNKLNVTIGKLSADWGGYEFDLNPIEVLAYNDILNHSENYLVGIGVGYNVNKKHRFSAQILNTSANKLEQTEGISLPEGLKDAKKPLAFVGNWRGSFWNDQFQTSYSYSYFSQAKNKGMYFVSLGNKYQSKHLTWMYDFQYSQDAIDKRGIISSMFQEEKPIMAEHVAYLEHWTRLDYQVYPQLFFSLTLMTSNAYARHQALGDSENSHVRVSYGVSPMLQYRPFKNLNLRFYAAYVGRWYNYSSYAKTELGQVNNSTGRISIGFIAPLQVL